MCKAKQSRDTDVTLLISMITSAVVLSLVLIAIKVTVRVTSAQTNQCRQKHLVIYMKFYTNRKLNENEFQGDDFAYL